MAVPAHATTTRPRAPVERRRIRATGTVQGVGFRPFVHRLATRLDLAGTVGNDAGGVAIEVEGTGSALDRFVDQLEASAPPLSEVTGLRVERVAPTGQQGFEILASGSSGRIEVPIPVDVGPCEACLTEIDDADDRRHRYPFTTCTDCGPRYTITRRVPYDRPWTTMAPFTMCPACQAEYDDPADRRFHAQPNACPACGPTLTLTTPVGAPLARGDDALVDVTSRLLAGEVVAVKGVGGFHLACLADDEAPVGRLRRRKRRDDKPFAVLVADVAAATELVELDADAVAALTSPRRPIVLAPRRSGRRVAGAVAPDLPELGVMLPPSPLHHLLARDVGRPLVLTSGNVSDEPIVTTDEDAHERLRPLVDAILTHDRAIHLRCDDSVVRASGRSGVQPVRRSRGFVPGPLPLPPGCEREVLAVGAELKSTVAVARGRTAVLSHHLGDLEHPRAYRGFLEAVDHLLGVHGIEPQVVAHDLHPEYLSTKFAGDLDLPNRAVQHHHAHIAACLAEHGEVGPVVGVALDGLGWGDDGTAWGGEILVCDLARWERAGHLRTVPMPGGAAAVREPWRMAVSWAVTCFGAEAAGPVVRDLEPRWEHVRDVVTGDRALRTSSAGRLFDAAAALLGVRSRISYEGQAAIELEALARHVPAGVDPLAPVLCEDVDGVLVLDPTPTLIDLVRRRPDEPPAHLAAGFHDAVAAGVARAAVRVADGRDLDTVALSGGVFQNVRLTDVVVEHLRRAALRVLVHRRVPANDGGISFGQVAVASWRP